MRIILLFVLQIILISCGNDIKSNKINKITNQTESSINIEKQDTADLSLNAQKLKKRSNQRKEGRIKNLFQKPNTVFTKNPSNQKQQIEGKKNFPRNKYCRIRLRHSN